MCVHVGGGMCEWVVCVCVHGVGVCVCTSFARTIYNCVAGLLNTSPQQPAPSSRAHWLPTGQLRAGEGTHGNH